MNDIVVSQLFQPIYLSFLYLNSVGHNLVIELCCALIFFLIFCPHLFSKLTYSFVAIELLAFKAQISRALLSNKMEFCIYDKIQ